MDMMGMLGKVKEFQAKMKEAQEEVEYTKGRYKKLRDEFSCLCDEYTGNMSRPFKS